MDRSRTRMALLGAAAAVALALAGCAGSSPAVTPVPVVATTGPSAAALMVCAPEAQADIAEALGVSPSQTPVRSYVDHLLTCRYPYTDGTMVLTVKDLPDVPTATAYLTTLRGAADHPQDAQGIGQAAFTVADGSIYVRKDDKVLMVDVTGLPATFGAKSEPPASIAITIAALIMNCWKAA
jgi:hypothetical protein